MWWRSRSRSRARAPSIINFDHCLDPIFIFSNEKLRSGSRFPDHVREPRLSAGFHIELNKHQCVQQAFVICLLCSIFFLLSSVFLVDAHAPDLGHIRISLNHLHNTVLFQGGHAFFHGQFKYLLGVGLIFNHRFNCGGTFH